MSVDHMHTIGVKDLNDDVSFSVERPLAAESISRQYRRYIIIEVYYCKRIRHFTAIKMNNSRILKY